MNNTNTLNETLNEAHQTLDKHSRTVVSIVRYVRRIYENKPEISIL